MTKTLLAATLAAVLAATSFTPAPARAADSEDVAAALLGIIALYAIANELKDKDKDDKRSRSHRSHRHGSISHRHAHSDKHQHRGNRRHTIPRRCIRLNDDNDGPSRFVTRRCLEREGYSRSLPKQCRFIHEGRRRDLTAYGVRCLKHKGYQVEARR